ETSTATLSLIYLGNLCYLTNEYQDAVNFYQSYLKNSSFDMRLDFIALKSMGQCYLAMGKIEEAERAFRELVNGEDVWPKKDGFKSLILVYEMENRVNEIRTIITQAFKDYPELQEDPFFMTKMGKYEVTQE
ncbi:MAG: tetratricopeptide repeat protein, partial [Thermodesulfobacteriota bacterium]|nr:tetratricopeptide repeat protein [Thermodesulfobacteriota bacterium]